MVVAMHKSCQELGLLSNMNNSGVEVGIHFYYQITYYDLARCLVNHYSNLNVSLKPTFSQMLVETVEDVHY